MQTLFLMAFDDYICHLRKQTESAPCLAETSSVYLHVPCSACEPSQHKESEDSFPIGLSPTHFEGSLHGRSSSLTILQASEDLLVNSVVLPQPLVKKTAMQTECLANSLDRSSLRSLKTGEPRGALLGSKSVPIIDGDNECDHLNPMTGSKSAFISEKRNSSIKTCHATFRTAKEAELSRVGFGWKNSCADPVLGEGTLSSNSASSASHSPSPVRSRIVSPFAAATMRPDGEASLADACSSSINDISAPAISSSVCDFSFGPEAPSAGRFFKVHGKNVDRLQHVYPPHLNPFSPEASDDEGSSIHRNSAKESGAGSPSFVSLSVTPSEKSEMPLEPFPSSRTTTGQSELDSLQGSPRFRKKPAPLPPTQAEVTQRGLRRIEVDAKVKLPVAPRSPLHSQLLLMHPPRCRSSSVEHIERCTARIQKSLESKSMVVKRQAPPLPVHGKRTIRADSTEEFVNYSELHEQLYLTNRRMIELQAEASILQRKIDCAEKNLDRMTSLIEKQRNTMKLRDILSRKHTGLLETLRRQELEERHANLEHELRLLLAKQDALKTQEDRNKERQLLHELLTTVNRRSELVDHVSDVSERNSSSTSSRVEVKKRALICLQSLKHKWKTRRRNCGKGTLPKLVYNT